MESRNLSVIKTLSRKQERIKERTVGLAVTVSCIFNVDSALLPARKNKYGIKYPLRLFYHEKHFCNIDILLLIYNLIFVSKNSVLEYHYKLLLFFPKPIFIPNNVPIKVRPDDRESAEEKVSFFHSTI